MYIYWSNKNTIKMSACSVCGYIVAYNELMHELQKKRSTMRGEFYASFAVISNEWMNTNFNLRHILSLQYMGSVTYRMFQNFFYILVG